MGEPGHPVLTALDTCLPQITKDSGAAIDAHALFIKLFNLRRQGLALQGP